MKNGDLLFVRSRQNQFEKMIANSTSQKYNYVHVGIYIDGNVIHATSKYGCIKQSLNKFIQTQAASIDNFRVIDNQIDFQLIKNNANQMIGLPYNHSFLQTSSGLYCSELITEVFKDYHIFHLAKLQFGNEKQIAYWKRYYHKLDMKLPVNELGSSPNSLIDSAKLNFIKKIN
ncbi:YiiX/YebB-like N1pC/P60 family cysteine hydrolase [Apilactobacillus quenuiae]|uniref:YiiX/YebB-like N1pC/P60 family cysteine hydrolase n=1 Tax=Apilactobacillus quenuiae TaxID=2008377 RepID=UPI001300063A|nr:YiiX/YebB-like N1pC/P60 family cysteine hydrolase [Apilactobacillus quenuiae]